jgi:uncharacterized damage-inducible protein DinB
MLQQLSTLFAYNDWANARYMEAIDALDDEQFTRDLGSSFSSIRDTVAHVVAAEWIWMRRWQGESPQSVPGWAVDSDLELLRKRLHIVQMERLRFLGGLTADDLDRLVTYINLAGSPFTYRLGEMLLHLVNHSTFHRGQLATMLRQLGVTPPGTDLLVYRDEMNAQ